MVARKKRPRKSRPEKQYLLRVEGEKRHSICTMEQPSI